MEDAKSKSLLSIPMDYLESMKFRPQYTWYKPILALLIAAVVYTVFAGVIVVIGEILQLPEFSSETMRPGAYLQTDFTSPIQIILLALSVAVMIPAMGIGAMAMGLGGLKGLSSVKGGLRWGRIVKIAVPVFALSAVFVFATTSIDVVKNGGMSELANPTIVPAALVAVVLAIPLQCAGEEYVFRGMLSQTFASWIPSAVFAIILQGVVFGAAHGYSLAGNVGIVIDGILWGWLTAKTGGLEASIVLHASNNVCVFIMSSLYVSATITSVQIVGDTIIDVAIATVLAAVAYFVCKKNGYLLEGK